MIANLTAEERAGRGSVFDSTFLSALTDPENVGRSLAEVWQEVEETFAAKNRVEPRPNPFIRRN